MTVTYVGHSCFCVEFDKVVFVFDYFEGNLPDFDSKKKVYFFVSHKHADHFSFDIFEYANKYEKIEYILSNEIKMNEAYMQRREIPIAARDKIRYAKKNDSFEISHELEVSTLTSTDQGVAYIIEYQEDKNKEIGTNIVDEHNEYVERNDDDRMIKKTKIYHAGDLNWWSWSGESPEDNDEMAKDFLREMKKLEQRQFDIAFVPLDPRQEERFYWGFDYFMRVTDTKTVFPMHCWEDYTVIPRLIAMDESIPYRDCIQIITNRSQTFEI